MARASKQQIIIAALLHDIGKFWQRADKFLDKSDNINEKAENWGWLVPINKESGRPGYQHAIWTFQFIESHKAIFNDINIWNEEEKLSKLAAKHHLPDNEDEALIQLADWWSSGIDRSKVGDTSYPNGHIKWGDYAFKKIPLHSIFNQLVVNKNQGASVWAHHLTGIDLASEASVFPYKLEAQEINDKGASRLDQNYNELWQQFVEEFAHLPTGSFDAFSTSLTYLLKKYTWCMPSSTIDLPNVSLFEHLKTTAAIAACLYDYRRAAPKEKMYLEGSRLKLEQGVYPLSMCCLDLSGIQNFIYDIASSKAYKSLKGRSFYLQLLMDEVLQHLLVSLGQSHINTIYSSGGKAYFLLPNTAEVDHKIPDVMKEIEEMIWEDHRGSLYMAFGKVPFSYEFDQESGKGLVHFDDAAEGKTKKGLGELWKAVSNAASIQKSKRFKQTLLERFDDFFDEHKGKYSAESESQDVCAVTGRPMAKSEKRNIGRSKADDDDGIWVLPLVEEQTKLGKYLRDSKVVLSSVSDQLNQRSGLRGVCFNTIGRYIELNGNSSGSSTQHLQRGIRYAINDAAAFLPSRGSGNENLGYGFLFYGGNEQPEIEDKEEGVRVKMLEELCWINNTDDLGGYTKLGVLRMDVDNLGHLFIRGFEEHQKSFAAYSTLSFALEQFFCGYINTIRSQEHYKHQVAILYAGGDDVFAVGRWDKLLDFAMQVRRSFERYVGRSDISLSAGMVIVDRKFPIYKAAELAEAAEKDAKSYNDPQFGSKNAICFFGETVSWNTEFAEVERLKKIMVKLSEEGMSRGLLHQLQRYKVFRDDSKRRHEERGTSVDFSYKWHSAYYLKRFLERYKKKDNICDFVSELMRRMIYDGTFGADRFLDMAALAARWVEYELKIK